MSLRALFTVTVLGALAVACGDEAEGNVSDGDGGTSGASPGGASGASGMGGAASGAAGMAAGAAGSMSTAGTASTGGAGGSGGSAGSNAGSGGNAGAGTSGAGGASGAATGGDGGTSSGGTGGGGASTGGTQAGGAGTGDGGSMSGAAGGAGLGGMAGEAGVGGSAGAGTAGSAGTGGDGCPASGNVSYTLTTEQNPTADQQEAYELITSAMAEALEYYNCYTNITKTLTVQYNPGVATADGNSNGNVRFGGKQYMEYSRAMHEIAHTVGVGTYQEFHDLVVDGIFTGEAATAQVRINTGNPSEQVHADSQHFWPGGLNYASEAGSEKDVVDHCLMVVAIRKDMGFDP